MATGVLGFWAVQGGGMFTQEKVLVEKVSVDDFGDEVKSQEWVEDFRLGLLDGAAPPAGFLALLGGVLFVIDLRRRRRA
jgi:hypothetical protein